MERNREITPALVAQLMRPGVLRDTTDTTGAALEAQRQTVMEALDHLTDEQYTVLRLRHLAGRKYEDIAERLNITVAGVMELEMDTLATLREHLPQTRAAIASSPALRFAPVKDQANSKQIRYDRAPIFAWLDAHPAATLSMLETQFGMSHPSAQKIRKQWEAGGGTLLVPVNVKRHRNRKRLYQPEDFFAWLDAHRAATIMALAEHGSMSHGTAERIRNAWRAQRVDRLTRRGTELSILTEEPKIVPVASVPTPIHAPAPQPIAAPAQRTWYEEQVNQARTFCEVVEEQERAIQAYLQSVQQQVRDARKRYEQTKQIAQAQHAMQRGQLVESMGE